LERNDHARDRARFKSCSFPTQPTRSPPFSRINVFNSLTDISSTSIVIIVEGISAPLSISTDSDTSSAGMDELLSFNASTRCFRVKRSDFRRKLFRFATASSPVSSCEDNPPQIKPGAPTLSISEDAVEVFRRIDVGDITGAGGAGLTLVITGGGGGGLPILEDASDFHEAVSSIGCFSRSCLFSSRACRRFSSASFFFLRLLRATAPTRKQQQQHNNKAPTPITIQIHQTGQNEGGAAPSSCRVTLMLGE